MTAAYSRLAERKENQYIINMNTFEEKRQLFLDMQEHPSNYSEDELQAMLDDPDMRGDIECFSLLSNAAQRNAKQSEEPALADARIEEEWQKYSERQSGKMRSAHRLKLFKAAAVFIGCLLMIGAAYAAVRIIKGHEPMPIAETADMRPSMTDETTKGDTANAMKAIEAADSLVKFDDAELETVLTTMAAHYGVKTEFKSEKAKHIHLFFIWNRKASLADVLEILNGYDRISVTLKDNTLIVK